VPADTPRTTTLTQGNFDTCGALQVTVASDWRMEEATTLVAHGGRFTASYGHGLTLRG